MSKAKKGNKGNKGNKGKGFQDGEWEFTFPNGDKYSGQYCAHVSGLAWRQGHGVYTTHDEQIYEGNWKDDKLNEAEPLHITFQNQDQYIGKIHKYKYNGIGSYTFQHGGRLSCNYTNNKPVGDVLYIDHHDELWYGKAETEKAILAQEHIFSFELDSERGKGRPTHKLKVPEVAETAAPEETEKEEIDMKELETVVFAKSFKTPSHVDFEESEWFTEFKEFEDTLNRILEKLKIQGQSALTEEEKLWYKGYCKSAKILQEHKEKKLKKIHPDLLRHYFDDELKNTCPPVRVFYPIQQGEGEGEFTFEFGG